MVEQEMRIFTRESGEVGCYYVKCDEAERLEWFCDLARSTSFNLKWWLHGEPRNLFVRYTLRSIFNLVSFVPRVITFQLLHCARFMSEPRNANPSIGRAIQSWRRQESDGMEGILDDSIGDTLYPLITGSKFNTMQFDREELELCQYSLCYS